MSDTLTFDLTGLAAVERELSQLAQRLGAGDDLRMAWRFGGPAAPYALYVHEDTQAHHPRGGTSHYLVRPLLEATPQMAQEIAADVQRGASLPQAMRQTGEVVMTRMKETTPVEFGTLRESGHVVGPGEPL